MIEAIIAAVIVALLSLVGVFFFGGKHSKKIHTFVLPVAVGVFLGVVFFELIPETIEMSHERGPIAIAVGFLGFYLLSHFLRTFHHHHHRHDDCVGEGASMLLVGDTIHNIADGIVIATAFVVDPTIGIATTIGIALHEIPQEIAEFGVLIQSGYTKSKALFYNFISALSIVFGTLLTFIFLQSFASWLPILTGIAAGNLLYIAASDLIPELRESHQNHFWQTFFATLLGVIFIGVIIDLTHSL